MNASDKTVWRTKTTQQLADVLLSIDNIQDMQNFLRDVMTEKEIIEISSRLEAAYMLKAGAKYEEIVKKTKLSSRTVARISSWIQDGCNGYSVVLERISDHTHILPVSAER